MKVLLFTKMFPRIKNENFGTYVYDQIKALSELGIEVKIIAPHTYVPKCLALLGGKLRRHASIPEKYNYKGLKVFSPPCLWARKIIKNPELKYTVFRVSAENYLNRVLEDFRPDILYALDPSMEGRLAAELGKKQNIPVVLIEHSMPKFYNDLYGRGTYEEIYKKVVKDVSGIVFVSEMQRRAFQWATDGQKREITIMNGFVHEKTKADPGIFRGNVLKLICIGYLEERKGYPVLFQALQMYKRNYGAGFHLTVIGDGMERAAYERMVQDYGIAENVEFTGLIPHDEVYEKLNDSDIFVLPSYGEALGIAYLEAMDCGLPVIGTKGEGIADIVANGENGILISKNNSTELCEAIWGLASNPERAREIAWRGQKTVKDLTWERNAEKLKNFFREILYEK